MTELDTHPEVKDFTLRIEPIRFRVDDDLFQAPGVLAPVVLKRVVEAYAAMPDTGSTATAENIDALLDTVAAVFRLFLPGQAGQRFAERLVSDTEPIDLYRQAIPILYYLLERWGLRPTQPSSASSDGLPTPSDENANTSSTDGASAETSTI